MNSTQNESNIDSNTIQSQTIIVQQKQSDLPLKLTQPMKQQSVLVFPFAAQFTNSSFSQTQSQSNNSAFSVTTSTQSQTSFHKPQETNIIERVFIFIIF